MIKRISAIAATVYLNEYIEKFSEIKPQLDDMLDKPVEEFDIKNDGCKTKLVNKIAKYIKDHGAKVCG